MQQVPPPYSHQDAMAKFGLEHTRVLNTSDPGTGKTRGTLEAYLRRRQETKGIGRMLVVAPLSILQPAWGDDITQFTEREFRIAHGSPDKRMAAFISSADIVLLNHDGIKWLVKKAGRGYAMAHPGLLDGFSDLVIDEFTAFKNQGSQRSRAMRIVAQEFDHITMLSGTPQPNTVLDMWHPGLILDGGKRLGNRFFQFRAQVCEPEQVGPEPQMIKWHDKPGAQEAVADALSDLTIRFELEKCLDIPENTVRYMYVDMPAKVMKAYNMMEREAEIITETGKVDAVNAAARVTKMLQILSGSVYDKNGVAHTVHHDRYALVMQLVHEREHSVVAFNWRHEREALCALAEKMDLSYAVIDGTIPNKARAEIVANYQAGMYRVIFCHPQSAAHGLTLTKGTATIWCTPTNRPELLKQFNQRIYRAGQTERTETIYIAARNTKEAQVYDRLSGQLTRQADLLAIFAEQTQQEAA